MPAGHSAILRDLAPQGVLLVPSDVSTEVDRARALHPGIPAVGAVPWTELAVLDDAEVMTALEVKAALGGGTQQHLGESAVIACAHHRGMVAILDDRAAVTQADLLSVTSRGTMWIVIEAYKQLFDRDRDRAAAVIDDLLETGMRLPVPSGTSLMTAAWEQGLLP